MKTSYKRSQEFVVIANKYLKDFPQETKLKYAIAKVGERLLTLNKEYNEALEDLELEFANVDANGSVLYKVVDGKRQYDFTAENIKKLRAAHKLLIEDERFEFKPHFAPEVPESFPEDYRPYFEGFVLPVSEKA